MFIPRNIMEFILAHHISFICCGVLGSAWGLWITTKFAFTQWLLFGRLFYGAELFVFAVVGFCATRSVWGDSFHVPIPTTLISIFLHLKGASLFMDVLTVFVQYLLRVDGLIDIGEKIYPLYGFYLIVHALLFASLVICAIYNYLCE